MPRPCVLDDGKQREVCALVSAGCGIEVAARYVGCNPRTIRRAAMRDADFYERLRQAELAAQITPLHALRKASGSHWRAAAWLLERTQPDRFARRNPRFFTEKQMLAAVHQLNQIVIEEVTDRDTMQRIIDRVSDLEQQLAFDAWAANAPRHDVHRRYQRMVEQSAASPQTRPARATTPTDSVSRACENEVPAADARVHEAPLNQARISQGSDASDAAPSAPAGNTRSDFIGQNGEAFCQP